MIVREKYEPEFWKVAFSSRPENVSFNASEFAAVSVNLKNINTAALTTELASSSSSHITSGQCLRHSVILTTMWVNRPLQVSQLGQLSLSSFLGR